MSEDRFNPPEQPILGVIGLGYVGLPLAVEFGQHLQIIGYDTYSRRIEQLKNGVDNTREATPEKLAAAKYLQYTANRKDLAHCNTYIVTAPIPVDEHKTQTSARSSSNARTRLPWFVSRVIPRGRTCVDGIGSAWEQAICRNGANKYHDVPKSRSEERSSATMIIVGAFR